MKTNPCFLFLQWFLLRLFIVVVFFLRFTNVGFSGTDLSNELYTPEPKTSGNMITTYCDVNLYPVNPSEKAFSISTSQDIGTTLLLTWTATPIIVSLYTVQVRKTGTTTWISSNAYTNQAKVPNLLPETQYDCRIITTDNNGNYYSTSPICTFLTGKTEFFSSYDIGTTLQLTWTNYNSWISSYAIQYRVVGSGIWAAAPAYTNLGKCSNLLPDTDYECKIQVYKNGSLWGLSQSGMFHTGSVQFTKSLDIGTTATVAWNDFNSWISAYTVQYRPLSSSTWGGVTANINQAKLSNLLPNTDYECLVQIYKNGLLWGPSQKDTFHTSSVQFNKSQDIGTTLLLEWTQFTGVASSYIVQCRPVGSGTWSSQTVYSDPAKATGFIPETDYECKVQINMNNAHYGTTQSGFFHTGKVDFIPLADHPTTMDIGWTSFAPWATSYILLYSKPPNPVNYNWLSSPVATTNLVTISVLPGQDYYIKLRVFINGVVWGDSEKKKIGRMNPVVKETFLIENNDFDLSTGINIYPNPFVEQINLEISAWEESSCTWAMYDMTGKQVMTGSKAITTGDNVLSIDASGLSKGIYMLNSIIDNQQQSFRIVKQ